MKNVLLIGKFELKIYLNEIKRSRVKLNDFLTLEIKQVQEDFNRR